MAGTLDLAGALEYVLQHSWISATTDLKRPTVGLALSSVLMEVLSETKSATQELQQRRREQQQAQAQAMDDTDETEQLGAADASPLVAPTERERRAGLLVSLALALLKTPAATPSSASSSSATVLSVPSAVGVLDAWVQAETIQGCERIFALIEQWAAQGLFAPVVETQSTRLPLLRLCNALVRRLSRTDNTAFCGRVMMLLAYLLPPDEKSGLNLGGSYHTSNVTVIADEAGHREDGDTAAAAAAAGAVGKEDAQASPPAHTRAPSLGGDDAEERELLRQLQAAAAAVTSGGQQAATTPTTVGSAQSAAQSATHAATDFSFYREFWGIQQWLASPDLSQSGAVERFAGTVSRVLKVFAATSAGESAASGGSGGSGSGGGSSSSSSSSSNSSGSSSSSSSAANGSSGPPAAKRQRSSASSSSSYSSSSLSAAPTPTHSGSTAPASAQALEFPYFPKYLTGPRLLQLQLRDRELRRTLVAQIILVLWPIVGSSFKEFRNANSAGSRGGKGGKGGAAGAGAGSGGAAAAVAVPASDPHRPRVLTDVAALRKHHATLCRVLDECITHFERAQPHAGRAFGIDLLTIAAQREAPWRLWKAALCPEITRAPALLSAPVAPASGAAAGSTTAGLRVALPWADQTAAAAAAAAAAVAAAAVTGSSAEAAEGEVRAGGYPAGVAARFGVSGPAAYAPLAHASLLRDPVAAASPLVLAPELAPYGHDTLLALPVPAPQLPGEAALATRIESLNILLEGAGSGTVAGAQGDVVFAPDSRLPMGSPELARLWIAQPPLAQVLRTRADGLGYGDHVTGLTAAAGPRGSVYLNRVLQPDGSVVPRGKALIQNPLFIARALRAIAESECELFVDAGGSLEKVVQFIHDLKAKKTAREAAAVAAAAAAAAAANAPAGENAGQAPGISAPPATSSASSSLSVSDGNAEGDLGAVAAAAIGDSASSSSSSPSSAVAAAADDAGNAGDEGSSAMRDDDGEAGKAGAASSGPDDDAIDLAAGEDAGAGGEGAVAEDDDASRFAAMFGTKRRRTEEEEAAVDLGAGDEDDAQGGG